jgi:hypothetical protein
MMTPIAIGGLIVGLNLGGAGSQGEVATPPTPPPSRAQTPQAVGKNPTTGSPSSVVLPSPNAGDGIAASRSTASAAAPQAAALQAVRSAVAAQSAKVTEGQLEQVIQAQEAAESAQAAAAAAAAEPGQH